MTRYGEVQALIALTIDAIGIHKGKVFALHTVTTAWYNKVQRDLYKPSFLVFIPTMLD